MAGRRLLAARRWRATRPAAPALLLLLAAGLILSSSAHAAAASLQERIAQCVACHGETGVSPNPEVPHIGGQPKLFVMYQLFFYRERRRNSPEMNTVARDMSDADLTAISDYVAALPPPPPTGGLVDEARYRRGAELARMRICGTCHNPDYSGREQMPRVAHQREAFLFKSFKDYQAGVRVGTQAAMAEAVRGLTDADLADLAYYLANFRPSRSPPPPHLPFCGGVGGGAAPPQSPRRSKALPLTPGSSPGQALTLSPLKSGEREELQAGPRRIIGPGAGRHRPRASRR
jgi:cytochrome c553